MRKNKGLNPAHHEVKMIMGDMLEPMYESLKEARADKRKQEDTHTELLFRRARATDIETLNNIALELKEVEAAMQVRAAEVERKLTCIRAFLMVFGQKVGKARRDSNEPDFMPKMSDHQAHMLDVLSDLAPKYYEPA